MSVRVSRRHKHLLFDLPTVTVGFGLIATIYVQQLTSSADANLFKEAFIKAQQENEKLFDHE